MEGHLMTWDAALAVAVVIDVVLIAWGCRAIARAMARSAQAGAPHAEHDLWVDDDPFESESDDRYSHGLLTNPSTGLPMLDGVWMDAAGNPYGTDLTDYAGSSFDSFRSNTFDFGCGGLHDT